MNIAEVIIQDAKRQGIEEAEQKFKQRKQQFEQRERQFHQQVTLNLRKKGFSDKEISEVFNISLDELSRLTKKK